MSAIARLASLLLGMFHSASGPLISKKSSCTEIQLLFVRTDFELQDIRFLGTLHFSKPVG